VLVAFTVVSASEIVETTVDAMFSDDVGDVESVVTSLEVSFDFGS
jgi:hypothetical protein